MKKVMQPNVFFFTIVLTILSIGFMPVVGEVDASIITIIKQTIPDGSTGDFGFRLTYFDSSENKYKRDASATLSDGESYLWNVDHLLVGLDQLSFMVFENVRPDNWEVLSMDIVGGTNVIKASPRIYFDLASGSNAEVTFTNKAVPIPGAALLLGSGLVGIIGIRRKFRK